MTKERYDAFKGLNLSDTRSENETREEYKERLKQNKHALKLYTTVGRDKFKELFPQGVSYDLFKSTEEDIVMKLKAIKTSAEKLGEAK